MSHFPAVGILRVLDGGRGNILCHMTIECHGQCLDATADAKHRYLAVDHSKLDINSFSSVCPLSELDGIIMDQEFSEGWKRCLEKNGVKYY